MEKILKMHNSLMGSLGLQTYTKFNTYILSPYVIQLECNDGILWYNNLTCELVLLNTGEEKDVNIRQYLIEHWYYMPDFIMPKSLAYTIRQIVTDKEKEKTLTSSYVIPTTTVCNARCPYCYEHGLNQRHMTKEMALDIAKFLFMKNVDLLSFHLDYLSLYYNLY